MLTCSADTSIYAITFITQFIQANAVIVIFKDNAENDI